MLGLSAGNPDGSAEILLKVALHAAEDEGAQVSLLRLDDLTLPTRPVGPVAAATEDDGAWLWDQVMESDGLIVSAPIYSRTIPGKLKLVADRLSGPAADVVFAENYRSMLQAGETPPVAFPYDERVFRPRVAGLIAVGGAGMPRAVVLDAAALVNAARVGRSVGSQLGRPFEQVGYRGEPGLCPLCHLSAVEIHGTAVECVTCGAAGRLSVADGQAVVAFDDPAGLEKSVIGLTEKREHFVEVQETGQIQGALAAEIERRASVYAQYERRITPGS